MANDLNSVFLVGRLTRDIEVKYTKTGTAMGGFALANTQSRKDGDKWIEEAHFFDCTLPGKRAEALQKYLTKGQQVAIQGTLNQDRWEKDGQKHSRVKIFVNDIQLLGSKKDGGSSGGGSFGQGFDSQPQTSAPAQSVGFGDTGFDDDIPF